MTENGAPLILMVEDDKLLGTVVAQKFGLESFRVIRAVSGADALRMLQVEKPDLLLLDLHLPDMNGLDLLEQIRAVPATEKLRVIVLSNYNDPADIERGKKLGVLRHVQKMTLTPAEVVDMVREVLGSRPEPKA